MSIFYSENKDEAVAKSSVPYERWNANRQWALHTYNVEVLKFMQRATRDAREGIQITNEIVIGERKRVFWERHMNFALGAAEALFQQTFGTSIKAMKG